MTTITKVFPEVLQYKWEAYYDTKGRSPVSISLSSECRGTEKSTAIQIRDVLQHKLEVYFDTFMVSDILLAYDIAYLLLFTFALAREAARWLRSQLAHSESRKLFDLVSVLGHRTSNRHHKTANHTEGCLGRKKTNKQETHKHFFHWIIPGLSWHLLEMS